MPTLGIGLPVYNGGRYFAQTLECLRSQTFQDFDVLIADNASSDDTERIAKEVAAADARFRYVRHSHNIGSPANFRYVFSHSTGELFAWVAADDLYDPEFFATCIDLLRDNPHAAGAFSAVRAVDAEGRYGDLILEPVRCDDPDPAVRFGDLASFRQACLAHFAVWHRPVLAQTRLLLPFYGSDRLMLAELALRGPLVRDPRPMFFNRQHEQRISLQGSRSGNTGFFAGARPPSFLTWHYARQLWQAVQRAPLDAASRRRARCALLSWVLDNRTKLLRSAARGVVEEARRLRHRRQHLQAQR